MSEKQDDIAGVLEKSVVVTDKVDRLLRHISNVQEACCLLGKRLIEKGEINFAIRLMANGQVHDHSKWFGAPEYWGGIELMPRIALAEMICDWYARSTEFGTSLWDYVKKEALPRYGIKPTGRVYKQMREFIELILDKPFTKLPDD